jgi:tetratricopeptide (TPR) repeat protein
MQKGRPQMNLTEQFLQQPDATVTPGSAADVLRCCQQAQARADAGDYEGARAMLGAWWPVGDARPQTNGLDAPAAAELLLRAGALTSLLGDVKRLADAQETAKDLLSESATLFTSLRATDRAAEAQSELAYCYFRQGALDEARVLTRAALARLPEKFYELRATALQRGAMIEDAAARRDDALRLLEEAEPLIAQSTSHTKRGRFHMMRAILLQQMSGGGRRADYADRALIEYAAARHYFEQAGHTRNCARIENNLGFLHGRAGRFVEAHTHFDTAERLFADLGDASFVAQAHDTRARTLLSEGRTTEAERLAARAVRALTGSEQHRLLAEALTTHGTALVRLGRTDVARATLQRAFDVAEQAGELEGAGRAALTTIEELAAHLAPAELRALYTAADDLLKHTQDMDIDARLRTAARRVVESAAGAPPAAHIIAATNAHHNKQVQFTPAAVEALGRLPLAGDAERLRAVVERTVTHADEDTRIDAPAVEVVALRQTEADCADPWAGFSLKDEVQQFEERLIELALRDAEGRVSHAAKLLGFRHHETLNWRLKNRNKNLLDARKPIRPRRRSIIRDHGRKRA